MADEQTTKKTRRLKAPTQTVRERAEQTATKDAKPVSQRRSKIAKPFRATGRFFKKVFRPFRFLRRPLRFLGKILGFRFIASSWRELRQVTWPDRRQTRRLTTAVLIFSVIFGAIVAGVDYGLDKLFRIILASN